MATTYAQTFVALQDAANVADVKRRLKVYDDYVNSLPPEERSGPRGQRLQQALDTLRINEALQSDSQKATAEIVQPAEVPTSPSSPKTKRNVALAIVLALVVGLALAALVDRLDRAVKTVDELERVYRLPVLARIPRERGFGKRLRQRGAAEALRQGAGGGGVPGAAGQPALFRRAALASDRQPGGRGRQVDGRGLSRHDIRAARGPGGPRGGRSPQAGRRRSRRPAARRDEDRALGRAGRWEPRRRAGRGARRGRRLRAS